MLNGRQHYDDRRSSPSASVADARHPLAEPESDYHSEDDHDNLSRNGAGSKRKRPISVSYVLAVILLHPHVPPYWLAMSRPSDFQFPLLTPSFYSTLVADSEVVDHRDSLSSARFISCRQPRLIPPKHLRLV